MAGEKAGKPAEHEPTEAEVKEAAAFLLKAVRGETADGQPVPPPATTQAPVQPETT